MLALDPQSQRALEQCLDQMTVDRHLGLRAAIVLKCAVEGDEQRVAVLMDVPAAAVRKWRERFEQAGLDGLRARRPPRPVQATDEQRRQVFALRGQLDPATGRRHTIEAIAAAVGLSRHTVFKLLRARRRRLDQGTTVPLQADGLVQNWTV